MNRMEMTRRAALVCTGSLILSMASTPAWSAGQVHSIKQIDGRYVPETLKVKLGDILEIINEDTQPHHIVSHTPALTFDLGLQKTGETLRVEMTAVGEIVISCDIHPRMELIVTVEK